MASLLQAQLPSDDEEDAAYAPKTKAEESAAKTANQGTPRRPVPPMDAAKTAQIEALWKDLKQKTRQKTTKQTISSVKWNETFPTPKKDRPRDSTQTAPPPREKKSKEEKERNKAKRRGRANPDGTETKPPADDDRSTPEVEEKRLEKRQRGGVDVILETMQKKKKSTVLDTSKKDWKAFKKAHAKDAEELEAHHKSAEQFLEKQEFLSKAARSEHEAEKRRKHKSR